MNRTNLILLAVLGLLIGVWAARRDWGGPKKTAVASLMFPDFNKEAVDRIEISGGWIKDTFTLKRTGSAWELESHGGYEAKGDEADAFIDAIASLRKQNSVGTSESVRMSTRTDEKNGRLVTVFKGATPMGVSVGAGGEKKSPKGWSQDQVFIRIEGEDAVYRTRTVRDGRQLGGNRSAR